MLFSEMELNLLEAFNEGFLFVDDVKQSLKGESLRISKPICKHMLRYRVIIEKDEDGILVAKVPDLPGCATEGKTRQELMKNVKEAIEAYLRALN